MREALNSVQQGMSVSKASVIHGIPRSTLKDHVHGRVLPGSKPGAPTLLSSSEEQDLVDFLCKCASTGCGKTRQDVMDHSESHACRQRRNEECDRWLVEQIYC